MSYQHVDVEQQCTADGLCRDVWRFWYDDRIHALVLDRYAREKRSTRRHKFVAIETYERLGRRRGEAQCVPPMPHSVMREARDKFCVSLRVLLQGFDVRTMNS